MRDPSENQGRDRILIRTKMNRPRLPAAHVVRHRLLERLDEASSRRITLISAPAGYGKTTLALQWLERCPNKVAWISLDPNDSHPERFLRLIERANPTVNSDLRQGRSDHENAQPGQ